MSDEQIPDPDSDLTAAEFVLGLLSAEEMRAMRVRVAVDPAFAAVVAVWNERLALLADDVPPVEPGPDVWDGIRNAIAAPRSANDNGDARRVPSRLRAYATAMTAIAASLALFLGYQALREPAVVVQPVTVEAPRPLLATLASDRETTALTVAFDPRERLLTIMPGRLASEPGRARQLWIIPAGGAPISLGVIGPDGTVRRRLPEALARQFAAAATIAISVEPGGGSPTGQPTGPVIASGALVTA